MATNQLFIDISKYDPETKINQYLEDKAIKEGANTIGRKSDSYVVIQVKEGENSEVSNVHAVIMCDDAPLQSQLEHPENTNLTIKDGSSEAPSRFGTYINGLRITPTEQVALYLGDCISLGKRGYRLTVTDHNLTANNTHPEIELSDNIVIVRGREIIDLPDNLMRCLRVFWDARGELLSYDDLYEQVVIAPLDGRVDPVNACHRILNQLRARLRVRYNEFLFVNESGKGYFMRKPDLD